MPYVQRDDHGRVIALHLQPAPAASEFLADDAPEVQAFVGRRPDDLSFSRLDADFVRVLEDLIDTLIDRHVLNLTDLPAEAQAKLMARKSYRERSSRQALHLFGSEPLDGLIGERPVGDGDGFTRR